MKKIAIGCAVFLAAAVCVLAAYFAFNPYMAWGDLRRALPAATWQRAAPLRVHEALENVTMTAAPVERSVVSVEIYNGSDYFLIAGESFSVEKYNNGVWRVVPGSAAFPDVGYSVNPGQTFTGRRDAAVFSGELGAGRYRIRKRVIIQSVQRRGAVEDYSPELLAEFEVG